MQDVDVVAVALGVGDPVAELDSFAPEPPPSSMDSLNFLMMKSTATSV